MTEKPDGLRVGSGDKNSTNSLDKENLAILDNRIRNYKFVRVGNVIGFVPATERSHEGVLDELRKSGIAGEVEDAGLLDFAYFNREDPNKLEIYLHGGSYSLSVSDDEDSEARKVTRELVKKVLEGTKIGLSL
ncbi:hypothetical protein M1545_03105 [Patescibacteria group bacterium]|nr:hypothetical protein [Patescibacteria group bacterium]